MAKCNVCNTVVKSCGCGGKPKKCACGFSESEILSANARRIKEEAIAVAKDDPTKAKHNFGGKGKWNKCIYCGAYYFYAKDDIVCPILSIENTIE